MEDRKEMYSAYAIWSVIFILFIIWLQKDGFFGHDGLVQIIDWLLRYVKVLIWPLLIYFLVSKFKNKLELLIGRIIEIIFPGGKLLLSTPEQQNKEGDVSKSKQVETLLSAHTGLISSLQEINNKLNNDKNLYEIVYFFEKTYRLIFGSQLSILLFLEGAEDGVMAKGIARNYYENSAISSSYSFIDYMNFLINSSLIQEQENVYNKTLLGDAFLQYLRIYHIPLNKPL